MDSAHCGECNHACADNSYCEESTCICQATFFDCDGDMTNGCESTRPCNACDDGRPPCGTSSLCCNENEICDAGRCKSDSTPETTLICDSPLINCYGTCINPLTDDKNCGICLNQCKGNEICQDGTCQMNCDVQTLCQGVCVDTKTTFEHCGACDHSCQTGQTCVDSTCQCEEGKYDCDGIAANGCESTTECSCPPGASQACWRGAPENRHKGICKDGVQVCDASGQFWGPCEGGVYPSAITCNDAGFLLGGDQDCDGIEDTLCQSECDLKSGTSSYIGCEYWPVFLQNQANHSNASGIHYDLSVVISNPQSETATIYIFDKEKYENASQTPYMTFTVPPGEVVIKTLVGVQDGQFTAAKDSYTADIDKYMMYGTMIAPNAFKLRSTQPVVVYQFNPYGKAKGLSADASLMLPSGVLGTEYLSMGITSHTNSDHGDVISIVATSPGQTKVTVQFKANTRGGTHQGDKSTIAAAKKNETRDFFLQQFEVLALQQSERGESTGTHIVSDKPIEVFSGAACEYIPSSSYGGCDHLEEQLYPLSAWGTRYAAVKSKPIKSEPDIYYLLAQKDNTQVTLVGSKGNETTHQTFTLNAREFKRLETADSFQIEANNPILVGQFFVSMTYVSANNDKGDPSFVLAVPEEQYRSDYAFSVPFGYSEDYVTIITPVDNIISYKGAGNSGTAYDVANITSLPAKVFLGYQPFGDGKYQYAYLALDGGTHTLKGQKPFAVIGYGVYGYTSYAYPIGLNIKPINTN